MLSSLFFDLSPFTRTLVSHSVSGIIQKACQSEAGSVLCHQGCFLGPQTPPAHPLPAQTRKAPSGPELRGSAGAPTPLMPGPSLTSPSGSPGAPTTQGKLSAVLGRPLWCQVEETRGTCGTSHTQHSGQHPPTDCVTLDGPRVGSGASLRVLVLISSQHCLHRSQSLSYSVLAAQIGCSFIRPSQEHRVLVGRLLPGYGAHLSRYPQGSGPRNHAQSPLCRALPAYLLVRPDPEPLRAGPELTNSCSWTGQ